MTLDEFRQGSAEAFEAKHATFEIFSSSLGWPVHDTQATVQPWGYAFDSYTAAKRFITLRALAAADKWRAEHAGECEELFPFPLAIGTGPDEILSDAFAALAGEP